MRLGQATMLHFPLIQQVTHGQRHCRHQGSCRTASLCPRSWPKESRALESWKALQAEGSNNSGLENYVGFTFSTPVNSDFHEVGGVATATVVSHHLCCLCHRDHLILSATRVCCFPSSIPQPSAMTQPELGQRSDRWVCF